VERVVGIVGSSGAGKTALLERLAPALRRRGLTVGCLKHAHAGFDLDREGSDSARVLAAGADATAVVGGGRMFVAESSPEGPEAALVRLAHCDVVLVEGYHDADWPKIVVSRAGIEDRSVRGPILERVHLEEGGQLPDAVLDGLVAAILIPEEHEPDVRLLVDGTPVPLARFAREIVSGTVLGMVRTLKGVVEPHVVELAIRAERAEPDES